MEQSDEELARLLQSQEYDAAQGSSSSTPIDISNNIEFFDNNDSLALQTDAPFKDLHGLFLAFNDLYFESKLSACEVRWSPRMTVCAGLCVYQSTAQYCSIRLSEPLLKFRPESDYIDTLLHEMIHAYLFVTQAIQDHDGHGSDFQLHMNRINKAAGTTITIYHTFHDEVRYYKTHVWKCNGPCQHRPPYYGIVKRSMNRPPQPADRWYAEHQESCGGTYTKISEPEPTPKKKQTKKATTTKDTTAAKPTESKPKPKPRTMLDNFLVPQSKPGTAPSSSLSSPSNSGSLSSPATPKPTSSSPSILILEDQLKETSLRSDVQGKSIAAEKGRHEIKQELSSEPLGGNHYNSPREAAAAAALARFESHLASHSHNQPNSPSTSSSLPPITPIPAATPTMTVQTKRKQSGRALLVDSDDDSDSWKKLKSGNKYKDEIEDEDDVIFVAATFQPPSQTSRTEMDKKLTMIDRHQPQDKDVAGMVACPVCSHQVEEATINDHVDLCIWRMSGGGDA
ncbi:hypothetical protein BGZ96_001655 [Linnemannia gamsii]|uniref:Protein with SprT-like domain at the N terminus n=1 Tax=Linnemannia gamsii TaxID=64522 RepID=A0ABQ7JLZ3_9FUNG|nr:hypothetical protein BGZ96_001655 [Linnemannia gamsii]